MWLLLIKRKHQIQNYYLLTISFIFLRLLFQSQEWKKYQTLNSKDCGDLNIFKSPQSFKYLIPILLEIKLLVLVPNLLLLTYPFQCFQEAVFPPPLRTQILFQGKIKLYP